MCNTKKRFYYLGGETFLKFNVYNTRDLISLCDEFKSNRSFNSWAEVFKDSLYKYRNLIAYKKRSKEDVSKRLVRRIVHLFWDSVCNDLIYDNTEVILKDSKNEKDRFSLIFGYIQNTPKKLIQKKTNLVFPYGGMHYILRTSYPSNWENSDVPRMTCFFKTYRKKIWQELRCGRRYYNSTKEKIFAKL